jgi:hypothetical protein
VTPETALTDPDLRSTLEASVVPGHKIVVRTTAVSSGRNNPASGKAKELLDAVENKLGLVPNMTRAMANSPAVLDG